MFTSLADFQAMCRAAFGHRADLTRRGKDYIDEHGEVVLRPVENYARGARSNPRSRASTLGSRLHALPPTDRQISALRTESDRAGDFAQSALCVLALGGRDALRGAEPGTEHARLFSSRRTQASARKECERVIAYHRNPSELFGSGYHTYEVDRGAGTGLWNVYRVSAGATAYISRRKTERGAITLAKKYATGTVTERSDREPNPRSRYEVVVDNVGTVYSGTSGVEARKEYAAYVKQSRTRMGRAGGESVTLYKNGGTVKEHYGSNDQ